MARDMNLPDNIDLLRFTDDLYDWELDKRFREFPKYHSSND